MKELWLSLPRAQREFLTKYTPLPIGKTPYWAALYYLRLRFKLALRNTMLGFWPRHSFVLNSFTPFVSDLDTSLYVRENFSKQDSKKILEILAEVKAYFPFVSEVNCYNEAELPLLLSFMNPFELARDPNLSKRAGKSKTQVYTKTQAAVFFFRMLDSDWKKLLANPASREKKWRQHFHAFSKHLNVTDAEKKRLFQIGINLPNIITLILELLNFSQEKQKRYREDLLHYFSFRQKGKEPWEINSIPSLWSFTPQLMIYTHTPHPTASQLEQEFFLAQLQWELWGIGTQFYLFPDTENYLRHLNLINELIEMSFPAPSKTREIAAFQECLLTLSAKWSTWAA